MRNTQEISSSRPREGLDVGTQTCLYRMHDGSGTTLLDACGNGPDITLSGTPGAEWSARAGYLTPNGSNHYARVAAAAAGVLAEILDFNSLTADQSILFGCDVIGNGDVLAAEILFAIGGGAAGNGNMVVQYTTAEAMQIIVRGVGETVTAPAVAITEADTTGNESRFSVLLVFRARSGYTFQVDAFTNGVFRNTYAIDFNTGGIATACSGLSPNGLTFFANYSASPVTFFNASGGDASANNYFFRRAPTNAAQEAKIAAELYFTPGEKPLSAAA